MPTLNHSSSHSATIVKPICGMFATMVEYKDRLQQAMEDARISPSELAGRLGTTYQAVKKVLDGKSGAFNAINHAKVAQMLEVDSDWLALGLGSKERRTTDWPFTRIELGKVQQMRQDDKMMLEAAILLSAADLGFDIKPVAQEARAVG